MDDDALIGVKSTARLFGNQSPRWLRRFLVATVSLFAVAVLIVMMDAQASPAALLIALCGPWAMGWHMHWQLTQIDLDNPARMLVVFRASRDTGLIPLLFFATAWFM